MYVTRFGLREAPFGVTPDPRYFFSARSHEAAYASLIYGIEKRLGFVLITGEVGTGKTLLCRHLLERLGGRTHTALIFNPNLEPLPLLRLIAEDFGIEAATGEKAILLESLNRFLLAKLRQKENAVLVLDEAQTIPDSSLEEIRLLSNLETDREKLLQIVLVGQPELLAKLQKPHLRQVNQRITVRFHLQPLTSREVRRYVTHRLRVAAGKSRTDLFSGGAFRAISRLSRGSPREINALCDRALLAAYAAGRKRVGIRLVYRAYRDLRQDRVRRFQLFPALLRGALPSLLLAVAVWLAFRPGQPGGSPPVPATGTVPPATNTTAPPVVSPPAASATPVPAAPSPDPTAEVPSDGRSLGLSLAALSRRWKMERLADDVLQWQFVSLRDRSLPAFFLKSGLAEASGMAILALPATVSSLHATDLPCLASEQSGPEGFRFVLLDGLQRDMAVVLDPVAGRRVLPLESWLAKVRGDFFFLVPRTDLATSLRPGDEGPAVLALQKDLRRAGLMRGAPDGVYRRATKDAVLALQRTFGLEEDGVAGLETRLRLLRLGQREIPSLQETR